MSVPFLLTPTQMRRIRPHFPLSHGIPRVDDRRVLSGIIFVIKGGLRWRDAPPGYGPHKTLYNRFVRWSRMGVFSRIFATKGGMNSKLHAVCDGQGRPVVTMLSAGQMNDQKGANILAPLLAHARELIADRGYDSNPFRAALAERGIAACIPSKKNRKQPIPYDKALYRQRHRIEIAFGCLKDWRRIATRYDRCANTFFGAITLAAIVIFWLGQ
jgi:transposase